MFKILQKKKLIRIPKAIMIKMYHFQEMKIIYLISIKKLDKKIYTSYNTEKNNFTSYCLRKEFQ